MVAALASSSATLANGRSGDRPRESASSPTDSARAVALGAPFGPHADAEWRFLTEVVMRRNADGSLRAHYDPKLAEPFRALMPEKDLELWPLWDAIRCPTLVLRGAQSDLLTKETCAQMTQRGPKAKVVEIPGVGHAPTLMHEDQIRPVKDFLLS